MDTSHAHGDGMRITVEKEPLRSVFALDPLVFEDTGAAPAQEAPRALRIERMSGFRRLESAMQADALLAAAADRYRKDAATATACELVTALGVWAATRVRLGLFCDASLAADHAVGWVVGRETLPVYAAAYRRSARVQDALSRAQPGLGLFYDPEAHARIALDWSTKASDTDAIVAARTELARVLVERNPDRALAILDGALSVDARPELVFEARETQVFAYLHRGDHESAGATSMKLCLGLSPALDDFQKYRWLRLHAHVHRVRKRGGEALRLAFMAATSGDELDVGPENRLHDLLQLDRLCSGRALGREAASEIRRLVRVLVPAVQDEEWRRDLYGLETRMLDKTPVAEDDPLAGRLRSRLRSRLELAHQAQVGPAGIDFQILADESVTRELTREFAAKELVM